MSEVNKGKVKALLLNDTRTDYHHGCITVVEMIRRLAARSEIDFLGFSPAHSNWRENDTTMAVLRKADVIIVNGEGTIHHDRSAARWLLEAGSFAKEMGKSAVLINATWDSNGPEFVELARVFDMISVRESASADELGAAGIFARIIPDLALYHQPETLLTRNGIGYTDCVLAPIALGIYKRMWMTAGEPLSMFFGQKGMRSFAKSLRRFLPGLSFANPFNAMPAIRGAITDRVSQFESRDVFLSRVAAKELIVTGRFHMMMFALSCRTPFLVVKTNTHKNFATLKDSGLGLWRYVDTCDLTLETLERASHWDQDEMESLEIFINQSRIAMEQLFDDIKGLV